MILKPLSDIKEGQSCFDPNDDERHIRLNSLENPWNTTSVVLYRVHDRYIRHFNNKKKFYVPETS